MSHIRKLASLSMRLASGRLLFNLLLTSAVTIDILVPIDDFIIIIRRADGLALDDCFSFWLAVTYRICAIDS